MPGLRQLRNNLNHIVWDPILCRLRMSLILKAVCPFLKANKRDVMYTKFNVKFKISLFVFVFCFPILTILDAQNFQLFFPNKTQDNYNQNTKSGNVGPKNSISPPSTVSLPLHKSQGRGSCCLFKVVSYHKTFAINCTYCTEQHNCHVTSFHRKQIISWFGNMDKKYL